MNQANDQIQTHHLDDSQANSASAQQISQSPGKERETGGVISSQIIEPAVSEIELPKELERIGVTVTSDIIEIPEAIQNLGVNATGPSTPIAGVTALPSVVLPISDQQVVSGLHAKVSSALLWLAVWCMKKLKKAHITLKNIHGKIIRVKI